MPIQSLAQPPVETLLGKVRHDSEPLCQDHVVPPVMYIARFTVCLAGDPADAEKKKER